tara:strand:+ start:270 stop:770 length:501 start_codon:yes stop_codon:yes gene_type:complete
MEAAIESLINWWPFWLGLAILVAVILLMQIWALPRNLPYLARGQLVTKSELKFYKSLSKAVQDDFQIFAMVRIADLLRVEKGNKHRRKWLNKILAKHIDFVLCDPGSLKPLVCLELDDVSHQRPDRIERDKFVNLAFKSAQLPLLRIPTQIEYKSREIRELIESVL